MEQGLEQLDLLVDRVADHEEVDAGFEAKDRHVGHGVMVGDGPHLQVVGHHQALVAELGPKQVMHDDAAEGGRIAGVDIREHDVGGHEQV